MIIQSIIDFLFLGIYSIIDFLAGAFNPLLDIPSSVYSFLTTAFTYLSYFVPLKSLVPLLVYHANIFGLRLVMMVLGLLKRIPLA